jgi:hypothetical protein
MGFVRHALDRVAARLPGGTTGNRNLTAFLGALLLVGILGELATLVLGLQRTLPVHILLGIALIPVVALKLGSTGWRMIRYYTNAPAYRREGPPRAFLRGIAPLVAGSTVALFGSGVGLVLAGPHSQLFRSVHSASFALFLLVVGAHAFAHLPKLRRFAFADWMRGRTQGHALRRAVVAFAVVSGGAFAVAALQAIGPWTTLMHQHFGG